MLYIIVDGDDIGRKITSCFIANDEAGLAKISSDMTAAVNEVATILRAAGFRVFFCAADGVVAGTEADPDRAALFDEVRAVAPVGVTFSAGTGRTLQQAYVALMQAKCSGKDKHLDYGTLNSQAK